MSIKNPLSASIYNGYMYPLQNSGAANMEVLSDGDF